ncbi:hypothetical protein SELMODRAFT_179172 [Selaginella moellendorffii]|uniref:Uncharacterized protein TMT4-1 n=1 Tax=Selaginella moellendorffii TaxID=88036 RepID=D8SEX1_SELML|nr:monosaccharide-sensing protein 2 [Selaginella moellendorffii]EFJ17053.1 hypothetical protein SELMODRAFT_179172 [Selaginella moellendorffii]|eukprot:XP_002981960.1 monosaccharide-sensing protein 2 [Selaginella moellendorffii]
MQPPIFIAAAASIGNFLQGWDNGAIAGSLLFIKPAFDLEESPGLEGTVAASSLIGAFLSTLCSGPGADWLGRRSILLVSAALYILGSCVTIWSPNVAVLVLARLLVGAGSGISVTITPIYIAELSPAEIRGQLLTYPQFTGSGGLLLSYIYCFCLSLMDTPNWRLMLGLLLLPSVLFLLLGVSYLPESPRWLVSKGKMLKARGILQKLRNKNDVAPELALLVEGLGVGADTSLQEWVLEPASETTYSRKSSVLSAPESGISWLAISKPAESLSRHTTAEPSKLQLVDPVVTIIGSLQSTHDISQASDTRSEGGDFDDEKPEDDQTSSRSLAEFDDEILKTPFIRRKSVEDELGQSGRCLLQETRSFYGSYTGGESLVPSVGIGGGWQLGWQWQEQQQGSTKDNVVTFKRVFLLQDSPEKLANSLPGGGEAIQAAALVGQPAQSCGSLLSKSAVGPAMIHPIETALQGPAWSDLLEGGVHRALMVAVVLQVLQQLSGINAVLYYVPQILQRCGAAQILANAGLNPDSASILGSGLACLLMLPAIVVAMRLMDRTGRRRLLLTTLPLLLLSLVMLIISNSIRKGVVQSTISFMGVVLYVCTFVMGFGPIPNILASEIFPTRVRGVCIGICQVTMWSCSILLTNLFPMLLLELGVAGIFGCFAVLVSVAWFFTLLKVPETKGMPLEVITEFFAMSARPKTLEAKA